VQGVRPKMSHARPNVPTDGGAIVSGRVCDGIGGGVDDDDDDDEVIVVRWSRLSLSIAFDESYRLRAIRCHRPRTVVARNDARRGKSYCRMERTLRNDRARRRQTHENNFQRYRLELSFAAPRLTVIATRPEEDRDARQTRTHYSLRS